ncbi:MAG TPA: ABC transporter substrate-binding protein [Symbiobacteriaceae bacterium]|nr:ABC transporter substrate-binding protein [Symbiobacteriaceae bacterium]
MLHGRLSRVLAVVVGVSLFVVAGCSRTAPKTEEPAKAPEAQQPVAPKPDVIMRIALNADPPKLDPHQSTALVDRQVFQSLFDKLVDFDTKLNIVPGLAEKWDISTDGKSYTFYLRKGVKFHDGTPFNAEAVKYNFDRMVDPALASPRKSEISAVEKVTVVDESTVKIDLKQPFAGLLATLADRAGMMVSPTAAKAAGLDFVNNPVGTGPFKFKERIKGDSITLVRNEEYWQQGLPKAAGVVYKTVIDENVKLVNLQSGQLDIIDTVPPAQVPQLKSDNRLKVLIGPSLQYQGLWINTTKPALSDKRVRQAISYAIDRPALVQVVFGEIAIPARSPFYPGTPASDGKPIPARDVAKAKALLAEAGQSNLTISLKTAPSPINQQIAQVVQSMLGEAGIKVNIEQEEFGQLLDKLNKKNYDIAQVGWSGRPDPDGNIYAFMITNGGNNYAGYSNPQVDKLLNDARLPTDMAKRKEIYSQIMTILDDEMPYVYLWHPQDVKGVGPTVQGYVAVPDGMMRTLNLTK